MKILLKWLAYTVPFTCMGAIISLLAWGIAYGLTGQPKVTVPTVFALALTGTAIVSGVMWGVLWGDVEARVAWDDADERDTWDDDED